MASPASRVGERRAPVLAVYGHLEDIPPAAGQWEVPGLRGAAKLSAILQQELALAVLFRRIATLENDVPVGKVDDWEWRGPTTRFAEVAEAIEAPPHLLAGSAARQRAAAHPPAEVAARRSAAHERLR